MKKQLNPCGAFIHKGEIFEVFLESPDPYVWVAKKKDEIFEFENYENVKAEDPLQALERAVRIVRRTR